MKIGTKISLSFFIIAIIITAISTSIFYLICKSKLENAIFSHLVTTAQSRAHHIEAFLEMSKNSIMQLSRSIVFEKMLRMSKQDPDYSKIFDMAMERLKKTEEVEENIYEIFILNKNGKIIVSSNKDSIGLDRSTDDYFLEGKAGPYIKDAYYSETTRRDLIAISAPILHDESKELLGVVVSRLEICNLDKITINRTGLGKTGEIYLVNKYGYMITPSRFSEDTFLKLKVDTESVREAFEDVRGFGVKPHKHQPFIFIDYRGIKVLGVHDHIPQMQWILLAEIDAKEAMTPLVIIKVLAILAIVFIPLTVLLISILIARGITRPIRRLRKGIEIIGKGNLDYKVGMDTKDEIGELSRTFDKMTDDLKKSTTSIDNLNKEITERKEAEEQIRQQKELLENTIESLPHPFYVIDANDYTIKVANSAAAAFGNLSETSTCYALTHKRNKPCEDTEHLCPLEEVKRTKKPVTVEHIHYDKDGKARNVEVHGYPIFDKKGNVVQMIEYSLDITQRKKAEEGIHLLHTMTEAISESRDFNSALEIVLHRVCEVTGWNFGEAWIPRSDGAVLECAPAVYKSAERLKKFRLLSEKFTFSPNSGLPGRVWSSKQPEWIRNVSTEKETFFLRAKIVREAGLKSGFGVPIIANERILAVLVFFMFESRKEDKQLVELITAIAIQLGTVMQRKKAEKELRMAYKELKESQEGLIQAEKLAAIGQLATGMAHGINNPLSVISGEAEMLFKDSSKDKDTRDASKIITEQARRIKSITGGLLGFSHKEEFEQKPLDINSVVEKSTSLLGYQAKLENIEIIKELEPNLPKILGSGNQLQEVFLCIMLNAIQAMEDGGKLTVRSRHEKKAVIIEFKDTGEGMNKETLKKIFNPFFSTKKQGTGLGLSIADRIIKTHKGAIKAYSKLGEGSTFIVKLPVIEGKR